MPAPIIAILGLRSVIPTRLACKPQCAQAWRCGQPIKAGTTVGSTDEIGLKTVENPVDTYDVHATVLQLLGLDHLKTTYLRAGRAERPTVVYGKVVPELLA